MEAQEKIELAEENIRQALEDYGRHTYQTEVLDDVSDAFIMRLAKDNYYAKQELREMFRKSPVWDEKLDALVINGTRTHDPDYDRIESLARQILIYPDHIKEGQFDNIYKAIRFFSNPDPTDEEKAESIAAMQALAPKAYALGKKPSRIFRALCVALGIDDENCERFSWKYAQLADEMSSRKIDFKLFVSLNPAHFITMSNPKKDERGCTLTSCHSFNSTEYQYNNGCSGYARDNYTFIVFTVVDPSNAETLNNRKNMRQIFCYKPGNGVLLQSRLYNDAGGTNREQAESKIYRDLVQREISALEKQPNLWRTFKYYGNNEITLRSGSGFGGYKDWTYPDFCAKVSIRADHENNYEEFRIGTSGLCIQCGEVTSYGLYCKECEGRVCDCCGARCDEDHLHYVYDRNGDEIRVCDSCLDNNYVYCDICESYHYYDEMTRVQDGRYVCDECLCEHFCKCEDCDEWVSNDDICRAIHANGGYIDVCDACIQDHYTCCDDCDEYVHVDDIRTVYDDYGNECNVGPCCIDDYRECEDCGKMFRSGLLVDGRCPDCAAQVADGKPEETKERIA